MKVKECPLFINSIYCNNFDLLCFPFIQGSVPRSYHKRSRSEDNILVSDESEVDNEVKAQLTPQVLGEAMSKDDQFYTPGLTNPFVDMKRFLGRKILETPTDKESFYFELPSPSHALTPPCTPRTPDNMFENHKHRQVNSLSLPSSPILLRKAAEQNHLESIHGSGRRNSTNPKRYSFTTFTTRSKSAMFSEAVAYRLQNDSELGDRVSENKYINSSACDMQNNNNNSCENNKTTSCEHPSRSRRRKLCLNRQVSADTDNGSFCCDNQCAHGDHSANSCQSLNFDLMGGQPQQDLRDYVSSVSSSESFLSLDDSYSARSPSDESCQDLFLSFSELRKRINEARSPRNSFICDSQAMDSIDYDGAKSSSEPSKNKILFEAMNDCDYDTKF